MKTKNENNLEALRHSTEHVLTQAMLELYPGKLKMAMGPATDQGFYFDFEPKKDFKVNEELFPKIEEKMQEIIKRNLPFTQKEVSVDEAKKLFKDNLYKQEWLDEIESRGEKVSVYYTGKNEFVDLCKGPHLKSTGQIKTFKLLSVAGAYWHGDEKNKMLTRIYGTAFFNKKELKKYIWQLEEAKKRDHRLLNQQLKLYQASKELGRGLITLLPNGTVIAEELEAWAKKTEKDWGYQHVLTPHIATEDLFRRTGHVPYYLAHMYPPMKMEEKGEGEKEVYYLKPMNCAHHHLVYKSEPRSYRDLPLRIAEYGTVYRYEQSGELHGMMRVRGPIHQNDAHIFCTLDQAGEEFKKVMDLHKYYYNALGLTQDDYYLSVAIRDKTNKEKYLGQDKMWEQAEKLTLDCVKKSGLPYKIEKGGAAFYGPKIDFNIRTVTGKVFSASTNQIDFFIPQAYELEYTDQKGQKRTPVCIHRAPLGSHVRFLAFLTEHFAGAFPIWLTPIQVIILPIAEKHANHAQKIVDQLKEAKIRVKLDSSNQTLSFRIRQAELQKIPYILVVGDREVKNNLVVIRIRGKKKQKEKKLQIFVRSIKNKIKTHSISL